MIIKLLLLWWEEKVLINYIYQLVSPGIFSIKYSDIDSSNKVIVRPKYMSICHADQRYYLGQRDANILRKKLPMALIHECCGEVLSDKTNTFKKGQKVVMIPNVPGQMRKGMFENYLQDSRFLSSGYDGFMREFVELASDRLIMFEDIDERVAAISEFVSVGVHAVNRFDLTSHCYKDTIAIFGDGSLSYVVSCVLKSIYKDTKVVVVGKNKNKLSYFSFVDQTYTLDRLPNDFKMDHAFECVGSSGSYYAINDIIRHIKPQGTVVLMGVSENEVPVNTRDLLEKGLNLIGCSRSGREDFKKSINLMSNKEFCNRLKPIIYEDMPVRNIEDINRVFSTDLNTMFKTVFEWKV